MLQGRFRPEVSLLPSRAEEAKAFSANEFVETIRAVTETSLMNPNKPYEL